MAGQKAETVDNVPMICGSEEIAEWFGVSSGTMLNKSKMIHEGLDLIQLDPDFTLPSRLDENPLAWMLL